MAVWDLPPGSQATQWGPRQEKAEAARKQYLWNTPDGTSPDFSETYTHGDEILVSWNALNNSIYDLWLTSWDLGPDPVTLCLARSVNLAHDGNLHLVTSDPPTSELASETRYALRFKPPSGQGDFVASGPDLSSPGFLLVQPAAGRQDGLGVAGFDASSAPTTTVSRATPSRGIATAAADEVAAAADEPVGEMSPGAAAGLTVGLILAVALLVAMEVCYFTWWRRKRRRRDGEDGSSEGGSSGTRWPWRRGKRVRRLGKDDGGVFVQVDKPEIDVAQTWMSPELPGDSTWGQRLVHELQGSRLGRGLGRSLTVNSSVVELEAGRDR